MLLQLAGEAAVQGDGSGRLLPGRPQALLHLANDLRKHPLRVLGLVQKGVDVGDNQIRETRKNSHTKSPFVVRARSVSDGGTLTLAALKATAIPPTLLTKFFELIGNLFGGCKRGHESCFSKGARTCFGRGCGRAWGISARRCGRRKHSPCAGTSKAGPTRGGCSRPWD